MSKFKIHEGPRPPFPTPMYAILQVNARFLNLGFVKLEGSMNIIKKVIRFCSDISKWFRLCRYFDYYYNE